MGRVRSPVLIGRETELAALGDAFDRTLDGHLTAVLVSGEAGIGKTRLVNELLHAPTLADADAVALLGGCLDLGGAALPFAPYLEALRHMRAILTAEGRSALLTPTAGALAPLLPASGVDEAGPTEQGATPEARRAALFGGVLDTFAAVCAVRPTVLIIEDLHWADRGSLELTAFLGHTLRDARLLLVLTMRDDQAPRDPGRDALLDDLDRRGSLTRIALDRLSLADTRRQLEAIATEPIREPVARAIHGRSGGNPFLAEELFALAVDGSGPAIPPIARDITLARLAALPEPTRRLVEALAVAGAPVATDDLGRVLDSEPAEVRSVAAPAIRDSILVVDRPPDGAERWTFRHALTREAVEDDLLAIERRAWHARWAEVLTAPGTPTSAGLLPAIARHLDLAGDPGEAIPAYLLTSTEARRHGDYDEAADADRRALALIRADPDRIPPAERHAILLEAAETLRLIGLAEEAAARIDELLAELPADAATERAVALGRSSTIRTELGDHDGAIELARAAVDLVPDEPTRERAHVLIELGIALNHSVRIEGVADLMTQALSIAERHGDAAAQSLALCQRGMALAHAGHEGTARTDLERSWELALASGELRAILLIALDRPILADQAADFDRAVAMGEEGLEIVERLGGSGTFDHLANLTNVAGWKLALGSWDAAESLLRQAERLDTLGRLRHEVVLARTRLTAYRGDAATAERHLSSRFIQGGPQIDCYDRIIGAEVALVAGDPALALERVGRALEDAAPDGTRPGLLQRLEAVAAGMWAAGDLRRIRPPGERASVERTANELAELADRSIRALPSAAGQVEVERWRAEIEAALGRAVGGTEGDPSAWGRVADGWASIGWQYRSAWARYRAAAALLHGRSERVGAEAALRAARAVAAPLGIASLLAEIDGLARRARLDLLEAASVPVAATSGAASASGLELTARERQVLALMARGRTNREIGEALFISPKTAGVHVGNVLGKLGVGGRVEAVTVALRAGLLEGDELVAADDETP